MSDTGEAFDAWLRGETGRAEPAPAVDVVPADPSFGAGTWIPLGHRPASGDGAFQEALLDAVDRARGSASLWR